MVLGCNIEGYQPDIQDATLPAVRRCSGRFYPRYELPSTRTQRHALQRTTSASVGSVTAEIASLATSGSEMSGYKTMLSSSRNTLGQQKDIFCDRKTKEDTRRQADKTSIRIYPRETTAPVRETLTQGIPIMETLLRCYFHCLVSLYLIYYGYCDTKTAINKIMAGWPQV